MITIKVKKIHPDAIIPQYQYKLDSGFDLHCIEDFELKQFDVKTIRTGLRFEIAYGYSNSGIHEDSCMVPEIQIRSRSGIASKYGVFVLNEPGTIDCSYTGEIRIILSKITPGSISFKKGDRIAQGVVNYVPSSNDVKFKEVEELNKTDRNDGGFGSTGI